MQGIVYKSTGSWYTVKTDDGDFFECRLKGKFRLKGIKSTNPVAVGDVVKFEIEDLGDEVVGVIYEIKDRKNYIVRKSVNLSKQTHIIAANLDQVFLMVTLNNPKTYTIFIDRFLATAEAYDVPAILIFNKIDTYDSEELAEIKYLATLYREVGYTCIGISAVTGKNVDKVKALMKGKTSMFSGHSGVGKSTLINILEPKLNIKTTEISEQHLQGQHTTTFAEMFDLEFGAKIIDTPGIKGFGIVDMEKDEIGDYFRDIFRLKSDCKFNNCLHLDEPKCAVKEALENNELAWSRYKSYLQMVTGDEDTYRVDNYTENWMRAIVQRVSKASVTVEGELVSEIKKGLLILLGIENADGKDDIDWLSRKIVNLRIFNDENGVMNKSLIEVDGDAIVVSQFTLHASTKKGNRPSYIKASKPDVAIPLYGQFIQQIETDLGKKVGTGVFGADMKVDLLNDGPVTISIDTKNKE